MLKSLSNSQKILSLLFRELGFATSIYTAFTMNKGRQTFDLVHFDTLTIDRRIVRRCLKALKEQLDPNVRMLLVA